MENNQEPKQAGSIEKFINWTMAVVFAVTLVGLAWRFVIYPLFFGWYE